jgi:transcriptional regulator with XRE-family HTH domain
MDELTTLKFRKVAIMSMIMDKTRAEKFSEWLVRRVEKKGISMTRFAIRAGVSKQVISKYLNDPPEKYDIDIMIRIAAALEIPPEEVFRAAGKFPDVSHLESQMDELQYLLSQMDDDNRDDVIAYARHRLERQEKQPPPQKQSSRSRSPARSALKNK